MDSSNQEQKTRRLRVADQRLALCIETVDRFIVSLTGEAYKQTRLLFNPILSRLPFASDMLRKLVFEEAPRTQSPFDVLAQLGRFYAHGMFRLSHYTLIFVYIKIVGRRCAPAVWLDHEELIVIDTFGLVDRIIRDGTYTELYFPGLPELLQEMGSNYVIFPVLDRYPFSLSKAHKVIRALRGTAFPIVSEFDLLEWADLVALVKFILFYPFDVIALAKSVVGTSELGNLLGAELVITLHQTQSLLSGFIRYLSVKRLAKSANCHINLIGWCENQAIDKGLYRGLRECSASALIYACQNYVAYPAYINMRIAESECKFKVTPDIVLVNGPAFLQESDKFQYRLGPSLRYKWLFSANATGVGKSGCVICLSYLAILSSEMLEVCSAAESLSELPIPVRAHPAFANNALPRLPNKWHYTDMELPQLLGDAAVLVTSESGTALEAAAVGTSVIIVASQSSFTCNPMFQIGKGELWDIAFDPGEVDAVFQQLLLFRQNQPVKIQDLADYYKAQCFVEPTVDAIKKAFDL